MILQQQLLSKHRWFSGRMLACHAGGPGSIPGRCKTSLLLYARPVSMGGVKVSLYVVNRQGNEMQP